MTHQDYAAHVLAFTEEMRAVTAAKNADYSAGTDDAMDHYHSGAEEAGITPVQVWFVLLTKHYQAIRTFVRTGSVESESIQGRFIDLANYAMLGSALVKDLKPSEVLTIKPRREAVVILPDREGLCADTI